MTPPETSIIVRTFNEERHLPGLLEAIRGQRNQDFETVARADQAAGTHLDERKHREMKSKHGGAGNSQDFQSHVARYAVADGVAGKVRRADDQNRHFARGEDG